MISAINNTNSPSFQCLHPMKNNEVTKTQILAGAGTAAAITAGIIYRKPLMKAVKSIDFKKMWQNTKNAFKKFTGKAQKEKRYATVSKEEVQKAMHRDFAKNSDIINFTTQQRKETIFDALETFKNFEQKV